jgi:chaperonin GroEL
VVKGMRFDRGYISPYFITNADKMSVEFADPYVLIYEKKFSGLQELLPPLEAVVKTGKPLPIITTLPVRTFCGMLNRGLGEGTTVER